MVAQAGFNQSAGTLLATLHKKARAETLSSAGPLGHQKQRCLPGAAAVAAAMCCLFTPTGLEIL